MLLTKRVNRGPLTLDEGAVIILSDSEERKICHGGIKVGIYETGPSGRGDGLEETAGPEEQLKNMKTEA